MIEIPPPLLHKWRWVLPALGLWGEHFRGRRENGSRKTSKHLEKQTRPYKSFHRWILVLENTPNPQEMRQNASPAVDLNVLLWVPQCSRSCTMAQGSGTRGKPLKREVRTGWLREGFHQLWCWSRRVLKKQVPHCCCGLFPLFWKCQRKKSVRISADAQWLLTLFIVHVTEN